MVLSWTAAAAFDRAPRPCAQALAREREAEMKQRAQEEEALAAVSAHVRMRECKGVRMCAWPARHGLSADAARAGGSGAPQRAAAQARPRCRRRRNRRAAPLARPPARAQRAVSTAGGDSPHGGGGHVGSAFVPALASPRRLGRAAKLLCNQFAKQQMFGRAAKLQGVLQCCMGVLPSTPCAALSCDLSSATPRPEEPLPAQAARASVTDRRAGPYPRLKAPRAVLATALGAKHHRPAAAAATSSLLASEERAAGTLEHDSATPLAHDYGRRYQEGIESPINARKGRGGARAPAPPRRVGYYGCTRTVFVAGGHPTARTIVRTLNRVRTAQ